MDPRLPASLNRPPRLRGPERLLRFLKTSCDSPFSAASSKKLNDLLPNEFARILQRKVACVQQVKLRFRNIPQVGFRTLDGEEGIVLPPNNQHLRLLLA